MTGEYASIYPTPNPDDMTPTQRVTSRMAKTEQKKWLSKACFLWALLW